jgi:two-component system chemotaxis response regulator CheY
MKNVKILIADDMGSMRGILKGALMQGGFTDFTEVDNGQRLLETLRGSGSFDIVISDWDMPKMSGLEALQAVRADERLKHTPFIMVTANAVKEKVEVAIEAGVDDYVAKPFQPDILNMKVKRLLTLAWMENRDKQLEEG